MEEKTTFRHLIPIQIRLNDIDILGHVNNSNIMEYFDLGKLTYLKELGILNTLNHVNMWVIVHFDVDFHQQIFQDDTIFVGTRAVKIGKRSMEIEQKVLSHDGIAKCTCRTIMCCYDADRKCSMEIPEWAILIINDSINDTDNLLT